ncbi:reactive intermediate/imine deaminase [Kribbella orskensis]|uniref:Reactive intermediate/imine deaminase n=1 Tax=Kribbella orskensis TaxID=2512216 RepID=A0ABY2BHN3_9ACTN|nr:MULTISPECIES: RidA family protein [Kribbella]TCN38626.1 reactive intermediate/imine deaminase [Kribbella sp. VKM Ac-2500]TCO20807.1 reactive intermediate/imine deaminase [Kribbella orskensis]
MTDKTVISTPDAPAPMPVFSQGVRKGNILQVSGQGSVDPESGQFVFEGDVKAQTTRVLQNIEAILKAGGATFDDVVMLRVYLTTRDHFVPMNDAYAEFVGTRTPSGVLPSRTTVFTGLPLEPMLVEIDALAVLS